MEHSVRSSEQAGAGASPGARGNGAFPTTPIAARVATGRPRPPDSVIGYAATAQPIPLGYRLQPSGSASHVGLPKVFFILVVAAALGLIVVGRLSGDSTSSSASPGRSGSSSAAAVPHRHSEVSGGVPTPDSCRSIPNVIESAPRGGCARP